MKKLTIVLIIGALLLLGYSLMTDQKSVVKVSPRAAQHRPRSRAQKVAAIKKSDEVVIGRSLAQVLKNANALPESLTIREKDSVDQMTGMLALPLMQSQKVAALVNVLKTAGQVPQVTHDTNAYTGEMAVVRTAKPLDGTRYFHAQYFMDEKGAPFLQHASYEIRPTENAMAIAEESVRRTFKGLTRANQKSADFIEWDLDGSHVVWIKKMAAEDLKDNPFNAYTDQDVGTVRVAVESRIHEDDEH